jgi:hypothetical protein
MSDLIPVTPPNPLTYKWYRRFGHTCSYQVLANTKFDFTLTADQLLQKFEDTLGKDVAANLLLTGGSVNCHLFPSGSPYLAIETSNSCYLLHPLPDQMILYRLTVNSIYSVFAKTGMPRLASATITPLADKPNGPLEDHVYSALLAARTHDQLFPHPQANRRQIVTCKTITTWLDNALFRKLFSASSHYRSLLAYLTEKRFYKKLGAVSSRSMATALGAPYGETTPNSHISYFFQYCVTPLFQSNTQEDVLQVLALLIKLDQQ